MICIAEPEPEPTYSNDAVPPDLLELQTHTAVIKGQILRQQMAKIQPDIEGRCWWREQWILPHRIGEDLRARVPGTAAGIVCAS